MTGLAGDDVALRPGAIERLALVETVEVADGRTIVARIAPYGVDARVRDGDGPEYVERIARGAFGRISRDPARVRLLLNYEHREGLSDQIGRAVTLDDQPDGLYGTFRAFDSPIGEHGLEMIRSGVLGLSIRAAVPPDGSRYVDGVVERRRLHLQHVALTGTPAYAGAEVLAVRSYEAPDPAAARAALDYVERMRAKYARS